MAEFRQEAVLRWGGVVEEMGRQNQCGWEGAGDGGGCVGYETKRRSADIGCR